MKKAEAEKRRDDLVKILREIETEVNSVEKQIAELKASGKYSDIYKSVVTQSMYEEVGKKLSGKVAKAQSTCAELLEHYGSAYNAPLNYKDQKIERAAKYLRENAATITPETFASVVDDFKGSTAALSYIEKVCKDSGNLGGNISVKSHIAGCVQKIREDERTINKIGTSLHFIARCGWKGVNFNADVNNLASIDFVEPYTGTDDSGTASE